MNNLSSNADRSRLRDTIATIERQISRLPAAPGGDGGARSELMASFGTLVEQLALGPEPEVRQCPSCGRTCMRAASRCGHCWTRLMPLGERDLPDAG